MIIINWIVDTSTHNTMNVDSTFSNRNRLQLSTIIIQVVAHKTKDAKINS